MKKVTFFALLCVAFSSCKEHFSATITPNCVEDKIESFKKLPYAMSIVSGISHGEKIFWFKDKYIDGGEDIINEKCEIICITDCECEPNPTHRCPDFDKVKWETIWQK
jgi:hypothetical protein